MRVSELFNIEQKKKKNIMGILLIITGFLSLLIAIITVYGQYTGTYLISVTREAHRKGIAISETRDFTTNKVDINLDPLNDVEDIQASWLDVEAAEKTDGQYYDPHENKYVAYTFYLKNTGDETINVNYQIKIVDNYKNLADATFFRVREYIEVGDDFELLRDNDYSKALLEEDSNNLSSVDISQFRVGEIRKFTFFVWIEGNYSTPDMMGGAIKFEWVFGITSALEGEESLDN